MLYKYSDLEMKIMQRSYRYNNEVIYQLCICLSLSLRIKICIRFPFTNLFAIRRYLRASRLLNVYRGFVIAATLIGIITIINMQIDVYV